MRPETDNPEKGQLLQKSARHRELLEEEVKLISERSEKMIANALIIGGALALTYFLVTSLSGTSEKRTSKSEKAKLLAGNMSAESGAGPGCASRETGIVSQIGAVLITQATGFLLSIAREKLVEFLQSQGVRKENTNEPS